MALGLVDLGIGVESLVLWSALLLTILYYWSTSTYRFWSSLGVPFKKPIPLFGTSARAAFQLKTIFQINQEYYNEFKDSQVVGLYHFLTPKLMLRDPDLIEHVMVKDFTTFMDRVMVGDITNKESLSAHLLNLKGQQWRSLRNKLAPVFTSGKMKTMMDQLEQSSTRLKTHLEGEVVKGEPLEVKYTISGYTLDVIGSCAFGLNFNAIDDPNSTFRKIGEKIFAPSKLLVIIRWLQERAPGLVWIFRKRNKESLNIRKYFTGVIRNTIKQREENNISRPDFIQLLMEVKKQEENREPDPNEVLLDDHVITSNSFVFLLAGYETTASTMSFMLYELSLHPEIQERLYNEVTQVLKKHNGQITWETVKDMKYLDMIKSETLRKYPPAFEIRRVCSRKYKFPKSNIEIPEGTIVTVPVYSLHHDPQYWPNPDKFDPERFSDENKHKIRKFTYLPFGEGPRICIGMRFAIMEIKMAIARLIQGFSVKLNPKTISPLQMDPGAFLLSPVGGIWLDFEPRKSIAG